MKEILKAYETAYHQMIDELARHNPTPEERRFIIEMIYKTDINIQMMKELTK